MYIVSIYNNNVPVEIHNSKHRLGSGKVVKGINTIDSFSFTLLPSNPGFDRLADFKTLIEVYNTNRKRYEFQGRVLYSSTEMNDGGLIVKDVTCESFFGFFCDSQQPYIAVRNWTVRALFQHILNRHNEQVEDHKHFILGNITVTDPNDNVYCGIQRNNTWDTIKEKLLDVLGGELQFRVEDDGIYIDYLKQIGETKATEIALSKNMKAIVKEQDPTAYITRLIPLGAKLGENTEERLGIKSVTQNGVNYIDDEQAIKAFGIHVGYVEFDDVTDAANLLRKAKDWLVKNNKVQIKYSITALDLSLLGLEIDDFEVHNYYPIKNRLLGIDDVARVIKKTIDVCEDVKSSFEVGDSFKTLSDLQAEQTAKVNSSIATIEKIEKNYVTNERLSSEAQSLGALIDKTNERITSETQTLSSLINQTSGSIVLDVSKLYVSKSAHAQYTEEMKTTIEQLCDQITFTFSSSNEQINNTNNNFSSKFNEIYQYIRFSEGTITLGESDSAITLFIDNDKICFRKNGVVFGSWDGDYFYTGNIMVQVNERAQFGNFAFIPRSDGSLMFLKVGE